MMRVIFLFSFLVSFFSSFGQVYQIMPQYGYEVKRMNFDSTLQIPTVCGVPTIKSVQFLKKAAIAFDSCNNRFYQYNPSTAAWSYLGGGGGSQNLQQVTDIGATTTNEITAVAFNVGEFLSDNNSTRVDQYGILSADLINDKTIGFNSNYFTIGNTSGSSHDIFGIFPMSVDDSLMLPVNDATKDTIATLRNVRNNPVGLGSVYDTAGVILARVRNSEATTLQRGEVVYIYGSTGNTAAVKRANNKQDSTSSKTFGVVRNNIAAGDTGIIVTQGQIDKLNLGSFSEGDILWLDSVSGQFTKNKPTAPLHQVFLGVVERANNGNGLAYIKVQNGYELNELHNVSLNGVANNQVLMYESSTQLWKNKSVYTAVDTTSLSNRINTKLNISDTSVFDRKSAAAYTFRANGTNATANMTDFTFRDTSGVYTGTITWTGTTAPSGATNHYYQWQQIGKVVKLQMVLSYATAGTAVSNVTMTLPSDCPSPALPAFNAGASSILYQGFGLVALNTTSTTAFASGGAGLRRNSGNTDNELFINFASTGPRVARIEVTYRAQ